MSGYPGPVVSVVPERAAHRVSRMRLAAVHTGRGVGAWKPLPSQRDGGGSPWENPYSIAPRIDDGPWSGGRGRGDRRDAGKDKQTPGDPRECIRYKREHPC